MAKSIIARRNGDEYQARKFWIELLELRNGELAKTVSFESKDIQFMDDVVVTYDPPILDQSNREPISVHYYQCKYHMTASNSLSVDNLIDPTYINCKESILKRMHKAYVQLLPSGVSFRLNLTTNSFWHPDDELAKHIHEGKFRETIFDGTKQSKLGKIRKRLAEHLSITEDDLKSFLSVIRFQLGKALNDLNSELDSKLKIAGLRPLDPTSSQSIYDDLIWKLFNQGHNHFDRESLEKLVISEKLHDENRSSVKEISIGSMPQIIMRPYDLQYCHLDLKKYFNGRLLNSSFDWNTDIAKEVKTFMANGALLSLPQPIFIYFDCHLSIAFLAGNLVNPKGELMLIPVQKMRSTGFDNWFEPKEESNNENWIIDGKADSEMAIAISVSNPIEKEVIDYLKSIDMKLPIMKFKPQRGVGLNSVTDGTYARHLGYEISYIIRNLSVKLSKLHIFYSGPVALAYIIGNTLRYCADEIQFYEYDFEATSGKRTYIPSILLPVK